jgi:superfamily II DNA/RNA helicase
MSPTTAPTFTSLGVPAALARTLEQLGMAEPFPIQTATLPDALAGHDLLGRGRTGSGKTLAFAIPTVAKLAANPGRRQAGRPRALVLVPTRELAKQVAEVFTPLAAAVQLRVTTVFGGVGQGPQVTALRNGADIVVACPGRLEDLIQQRHCRLDHVEVTVLDEADHMADLGFLPAVRRLLDATPTGGQRLLFSATLDRDIDAIVKRYLTNPVVHSVDPEVAPVSTMTHHVFTVSAADKNEVVRQLSAGMHRTLLFTRTKHGAKRLAQQLSKAGTPSVELHGNLSQNARERNLAEFTAGRSRVLVATDVAARGLHVDDIALVVHVDPPAEHKAFLHRSGRTARAGNEGVVVTIATPDQSSAVRQLAKAAKINPMVTSVRPGAEVIRELAGPAAPLRHVAPVAPAPSKPSSHRSPKPSASGRPAQPGNRNQRRGRHSSAR